MAERYPCLSPRARPPCALWPGHLPLRLAGDVSVSRAQSLLLASMARAPQSQRPSAAPGLLSAPGCPAMTSMVGATASRPPTTAAPAASRLSVPGLSHTPWNSFSVTQGEPTQRRLCRSKPSPQNLRLELLLMPLICSLLNKQECH